MQQRMDTIRAAERRSRMKRLFFLSGIVAISALVVTEPLIATWQRVHNAFLRDQYALSRARLVQAQLQAANARIRSELVSLRTERTKQGNEREHALATKIAELEEMIESVTNLEIFPNGNSTQRSSRVKLHPHTPAKSSPLIAVLESPQLRDSDSTGDGSAEESGIGGAEELCPGGFELSDECAQGQEDLLGSFSERGVSEDGGELIFHHEQLMTRIDRFISVLQLLPLGAPVQGRLSSGYGHRRSPFSHRASFHYGIDIALRVGSKIRATGAGTIIKVAHTRTYGRMVDIEHAPGLISRYAHLSKVHVTEGQKVERGEVIALSGNSGRSTGPHLHYEVRHNGKARNPAPFVQLAGRLSEYVDLGGAVL